MTIPAATGWLYDRVEARDEIGNPYFALYGAVNLMRAWAIWVKDSGDFDVAALKATHAGVQRRAVNVDADTVVFSSYFMGLQYLSGLFQMKQSDSPSVLARTAAVTWYYGIYFGSHAMIAAQDGNTQPKNHAASCKAYYQQLVRNNRVVGPFEGHTTTLVKATYENEVATRYGATANAALVRPTNLAISRAIGYAYIKGSADWYRKKEEAVIIKQSDNGTIYPDFRTKAARGFRDGRLAAKGGCGFLHQAYRFRGKANYRDHLFLSYGPIDEIDLEQYVRDLYSVVRAFLLMGASFASRRVERDTWADFVDDVRTNSNLTLPGGFMKKLSSF